DNETLFDALQEKLPVYVTMADRVRVQNLGMSLLAFSQGIPFFHAGVEVLRSKSGDRNSYNSGDWFNKLDFTYATNNWGVGLPPAGDNQNQWPILAPLLANPALKPAPGEQTFAAPTLIKSKLKPHPIQLLSPDPVAKRAKFNRAKGEFTIPGRTAVVFWSSRSDRD